MDEKILWNTVPVTQIFFSIKTRIYIASLIKYRDLYIAVCSNVFRVPTGCIVIAVRSLCPLLTQSLRLSDAAVSKRRWPKAGVQNYKKSLGGLADLDDDDD